MARPIRTRPIAHVEATPTAPPTRLSRELEDSAGSLAALLDLVRLLDERGVLRLGSDLLRQQDRVVEVFTERLDPTEVRALLRAARSLADVVRKVDARTLESLAGRIPAALREGERSLKDAPVGPFDVIAALGDPDVNRGVRMLLGFLRGLGRADSLEGQ